MRFSWLKWMLIVAALFVASGNAHAFAGNAAAKTAEPCAAHHHDAGHHHSHGLIGHDDCCCSCANCPAGLIAPFEAGAPSQVAYDLDLAPSLAAVLADRTQPPELDPPRPGALS
jgi:hypothetical protein